MKALSVICILIASLGGPPLVSSPAPTRLNPISVEHTAVTAEEDPDNGATCEDSCDVAEEWCAAGCDGLSAECPATEDDKVSECISPKAMCEAGCQQELEACQARCDTP